MNMHITDGPMGPGGPGTRQTDLTLLVLAGSAAGELSADEWTELDGAVAIEYAQLSVEALEELNPNVVMTALVSPGFDCTDVARVLQDAEFSGELRVMSGPLPDPKVVSNELRRNFPTLDIDIWTLKSL